MYDALKRQLTELIEAGDAQALERFVLDHFTEFPEEMQGKLLATFYIEAIGTDSPDDAVRDLQEEGLALMDKLAALKKELERK